MRRRLITALWVTLACITLGSLPASVGVIFAGTSLIVSFRSALYGIVYSSFIAVPSVFTIPRVFAAMDHRSAALRVGTAVALLTIFSVTGCLLANLFFVVTGALGSGKLWSTYFTSLRVCLLITLTFGALTTALMTLQGRLESAKAELHHRQIAEERERKMAAEARFASLESRVHPHFLFNTLNSISALVRENPAEAERMIERLSALLRYSLDSEIAGLVPLREELRIVNEYLAIEQVRFGQRLRYRIESQEHAGDRMVPALSVQTLVENSVKYAVGTSREGAEIIVSAALVKGVLRVEVADDGPGFEPAACLKAGHGLDLLKRRLESLFGPAAALEMSAANGRTQVCIQVNNSDNPGPLKT